MHDACFHGQTEIAKDLIDQCGVDINDQDNVMRNELKWLLNRAKYLRLQDGSTALMFACQEGHLSTTKLLVSKSCDANIRNKVLL